MTVRIICNSISRIVDIRTNGKHTHSVMFSSAKKAREFAQQKKKDCESKGFTVSIYYM